MGRGTEDKGRKGGIKCCGAFLVLGEAMAESEGGRRVKQVLLAQGWGQKRGSRKREAGAGGASV